MYAVNRDEQIKAWRPSITSIRNTTQTTEIELFQNNILRPILKLQHTTITTLFQHGISKRKENLKQMTQEEQIAFVAQVFQKDITLRNTIIGLVLGLLTEDELSFYFIHKSSVNKRISQMAQQRILSSF
jgi:hypothetical protein